MTPAATSPESGSGAAADRWFVAAAMLLSLCVVGSFAVVPYLPTNDGPAHIFSAWLWHHIGASGQVWQQAAALQVPRTGAGFFAPFYVLEPLLGWRVATSGILAGTALLGAWGVLVLGRVLHGRWSWPTLVAFGGVYGWTLYMGFFNFWIATSLLPWVVAGVVATGGPAARNLVPLALASALVSWFHVFAGLALGLVLGVVALSMPNRLRALGWLLVASLPTCVVLSITLDSGALVGEAAAQRHALEDYFAEPMRVVRLDLFGRFVVAGDRWRSDLLVWGTSLAALAMASRSGATGAVARAAVVLMVLYAVVPFDFVGWQGFAPRFGAVGLMFAIACLPARVGRPSGRLIAAAAVAYGLASVGYSTAFHVRTARDFEPVLEGLTAGEPTSVSRVFVALERVNDGDIARAGEVPLVNLTKDAAALYALVQGGVPLTMHAMSHSPIRLRLGALPVEHRPVVALRFGELAAKAAAQGLSGEERAELSVLERHWVRLLHPWGEAIVYGGTAARSRLLERGFEARFAGEHVALMHFVGCEVVFELATAVPAGARTLVQSGIGPAPIAPVGDARPGRLSVDGRMLVASDVPCGDDVEVMALIDADGGPDEAGDVRCLYGGRVERGGTQVACVAPR